MIECVRTDIDQGCRSTASSYDRVAARCAKSPLLQEAEFIAYPGRLLELQVTRKGEHGFLEPLDFAADVLLRHVLHPSPLQSILFQPLGFPSGFLAVDAIDEIANLRRNPSLSASRIATNDTSGMSRPSRNRLMPTSTSKAPKRRSRMISTRSTVSTSLWR